MQKVSLVLSSGGARGYSHIAAIEELIKAGYYIESISGSSMGALIGGLYACGKMQEYKEWVETLKFIDVAKLLDFSFKGDGFIGGSKVFEVIENMIGDVKIEDLPISFTAVATDIISQKEVWFQKGRLLDALRASIAIPTVFTPKKIGKKYFVDGAVLNPLPIAPTISDDTDLTIAVNVNSKNRQNSFMIKKSKKKDKKEKALFAKFESKVNNMIEKKKDNDLENIGILSIMTRSIDAMQKILTEYKIAGYSPDLVINIPGNSFEFYEFHKAKEIIEYARNIVKQDITKLQNTQILQ